MRKCFKLMLECKARRRTYQSIHTTLAKDFGNRVQTRCLDVLLELETERLEPIIDTR